MADFVSLKGKLKKKKDFQDRNMEVFSLVSISGPA